MVNEHSTNPEPQGSDLSAPDDVATNSVAQPDSNMQSGLDSSHNDSETQQDNESSLAASDEDISSADAADDTLQEDFGDVFAGVVETSADNAETGPDAVVDAADTEELSDAEQPVTEEAESIEDPEEELSNTEPEPETTETIDPDMEVHSADITPEGADEGEDEIDIDPDSEFVAVSNESIDSETTAPEASEVHTTISAVSESDPVVDDPVVDDPVVDESDVSDADSIVGEPDVSGSDPTVGESDVSDADSAVDESDVSDSQSVVEDVEDVEETGSDDDKDEDDLSDSVTEDVLERSSDDVSHEEESSVNDSSEDESLGERATVDDDDDWEDEETTVTDDNIPPVEPETSIAEPSVEEPEATVDSVSEPAVSPSPVQNSQPTPPPPTSPAPTVSKAKPKANDSGTSDSPSVWQKIQPILIAVVVIVLTTLMQWLSLGQEALETIKTSKAESSGQSSAGNDSILVSIWKMVQPILVTVLLFSSRTLASGMGWLLSRIDADAAAAVADGTAPTLPKRIQSMPAGDKIWDILETIWKLWAGLLGFLRDRIFPESIRQWSNQAITAIVAFVIIFVLWVSSALSPSPAQEVASGGGATPVATDMVPSSARSVPDKKANPSKDQTLATSIQEHLTEQFSFRYSDGLIQDVTIDRQYDLLTVTIGQEWYDLSDRQRQRLAKTILEQTADTPFEHLALVNLDGVRIARNPVVGSDMILFQTVPPVIEEPIVEEPVEESVEEPVEEPIVEDSIDLAPDLSERTEEQAPSLEDYAAENTESNTVIEDTSDTSLSEQEVNQDYPLILE